MLFIYQSVFRVLSNNKLTILNVFTFAGVISKGRMAITRISNVRVVSRLFRGIFSFGMFGMWNRGGGGQQQGAFECAELTFCRKHGICYKYNRLTCTKVDCRLGRHICKMCWRIDQSEEHYHPSDEIGSCPNMSLDYKNSLSNGGAGDVMNESQAGSDLEHENENELQSSHRGHLSLRSRPSRSDRGRSPAFQFSGRGRSSLSSDRGSNLTSQPSGRGCSSQPTIERGRNLTSQPSGRGGHSQSMQPLNLSTRNSDVCHPSAPSNQVNSLRDMRLQPTTSNQMTPPQYEQAGDAEVQKIPNSVSKIVDPGVVLSLREENLDLKGKLIATKSDLQDEKYQHQMLQVKFAELERKYERQSEENNQLKCQLDRNRQMQRLFPAFQGNSTTNQDNAYKAKQCEENEYMEMRYNDGSNFNRGAYGEESMFNLEGGDEPMFNLHGSPQKNFF